MKHIIGIILGLAVIGTGVLFILGGESSQETQVTTEQTGSVQIATSIYPLSYLAERIAGDQGEVINVGANQDPHDFRPSARDIQTMQDADLVILQGAQLEPWGEDIEAQLKQAGTRVLLATEGLDLFEFQDKDHDDHHDEDRHDDHDDEHKGEKHDDHDEHDHGNLDPHTWLDPVLMIQTVRSIEAELSVIDPSNSELYATNASVLVSELQGLDEWYKSGLLNCDLEEVITSHDAFGYIGRRYGFEIHTISGLSTQDQPSAVTLAELREEAEEGVGAILLEDNSVNAYGETLARETGLDTISINPIVSTIPDGQDYFNIMNSNLESFKIALQCNG